MAVKYRLGLDVGTASVGAAAVSLDSNGQPDGLIWHHVRIFNEPLENGQAGLVSKKAGRRRARMQRRQIDRRASRLRHIAHLSNLLGLKREEVAPDDGSTLPYLRARSATERVALDDLFRILLRLSKRRGYKGEFKAKKKGEVAEGSNELSLAMRALAEQRGITLKDENDTGITLGQYLLHRMESGFPTKLKIKEISDEPKNKKIEDANVPKNLYALRRMVEHEFNTIWDTQASYHDTLNGKHAGKSIREHFYEALFFQRPLKSSADLVAQCCLEPTLPRAPRAQMAFQRFRIEKTLADLRWGAGKRAEPLMPAQKKIIRDLLDRNDKVKFEDIYEALEDSGCGRPQGKGLNLDRASREELPGNCTLAALRKLDRYSTKHHPERAANLEQTFLSLAKKTIVDGRSVIDRREQIAVINFLAELGSPEQLDDPAWHTSFVKRDGKPRQFSDTLIGFVNLIKEHDNFDRLGKMDFDGGRASYSVKALNALSDWLEEPNWPGDWKDDMRRMDEEAAIRVCYPKSLNLETKRLDKLPAPESTGNAVVDGSLRQIRWTVNRMIAELGVPPEEIVVEMAREMSLGISRRNEREVDNTKQQKARREAEKEIRLHGKAPTPPNIRRYLLWAEQDKSFCPYCNKTISLAEVLSADTEFEHILPKKLTQVGLKRSEIVLAHYNCNQEKGDRTPWDAWGGGQNNARWQSVEAAAARFDTKKNYRKAKLLRLKDFEREVLTDESIDGFADSQFHHTSWIAKEATQWLECLCPNKVSVSRGELTSMLRRSWKLETVIPEVRYENNLPVLDTGGKVDDKGKALSSQPITPDEFASLKKYLEGHPVRREDRKANPDFDFNRRPDKRLDHRHHLIDAITLALTSRGLFQQMAKNYKAAAEKMLPRDGETAEERECRIKTHTRLRLEVPEPPLRNVRAAALSAARECHISIKPDRYPDGALFKGTAYGVAQRNDEEKLRLTLRQPIAELGKVKGKTSLEAARKAIANIVSNDVRRIVSDAFENRINSGIDAGVALSLPFQHPLYATPIRKIRCFENYAEDTHPVSFANRDDVSQKREPKKIGSFRKYLVNEGYSYLELSTDYSREPRLVKIRDAMRDKYEYPPLGTTRLSKGDTIKDSKDGKMYRVGYFTAEGNIFLIPIFDPRSFDKITEAGSSKKKVAFSQAIKRLSLVIQA
ncbi:MAG: type II CRISPR RNA-guided endonuclease Cas9 [Gallionella sp.]|nr:type II CRISPR RNA-guided endonuclease Cas9 [Gallionella sp.]